MKYEVIDNFLDEMYFDSLVTFFTGNGQAEWFFYADGPEPNAVQYVTPDNDKLFYMYHMFFEAHFPESPFYSNLMPLLDRLDVKHLIRMKANFYPNTERLQEHPMHVDMEFSHSGAILSLNTCDGYTKLKDGTKIDSVANRVLLFDGNKEYCSTNATNVFARFNFSINYIHKQNLK